MFLLASRLRKFGMSNGSRALFRRTVVFFFSCSVFLFGQSNSGELRIKVTDPSGTAVRAPIHIVSEANQYQGVFTTDDRGTLTLRNLPFGVYQIQINQAGFAEILQSVDVHSSIPAEHLIQLRVESQSESVTVSAANTLIDPDQVGSVSQVGPDFIRNRLSSIPGRSIQDLVNSQPGWLYEGNAVLHPRGSEYQTQFVVNGIPLTDNRSPSFGPAIDADDVQAMTIYTAGIPAEYGRKMGGVVEVNTLQNPEPGFHGQVVLSGGSFDTASSAAQGQYSWGENTLGVSASGGRTNHYLNPVVPENYTNIGTLGDFSANYERDLTPKDRVRFIVRHELSRYEIPNEQIQENAGQRQTADNIETLGIASYEHIFSSNALADFRTMVRDNNIDFNSNPQSDPIQVFQNNFFREAYFRGTTTINRGRHEWKVGFESDNMFLNENFRYHITDPSQFDDDTPIDFSFLANKPDLEQSAFIQDQIRLQNWTISAGLRWDHYQLLLNRHAVDPRFAISRNFASADVVVHFSYDRVFQTPSFENILLSSSTAVESIDPTSFLKLPVEPSEGNYYEAGLTKVFFDRVKLDTNYFRRVVSNYADDDQIQNTAISFPIAFSKAVIYGAEGKLEVPDWQRFSGFLSYSYMVGNAWYPVTGGLFLGDDAQGIPISGHFPDSQDQRNTVRGRLRYQVHSRFWIAGGIQYDTGLPFEFQCNPTLTLQQCVYGPGGPAQIYGQEIVNRINFARGRTFPSFQVSASAGADLYKSERRSVRFQIDGQNLTNVLDVIDFGGLFSGNAIGPSRSFAMRLTSSF